MYRLPPSSTGPKILICGEYKEIQRNDEEINRMFHVFTEPPPLEFLTYRGGVNLEFAYRTLPLVNEI